MHTDDWRDRLEMEEKIKQAGEVTLDRLQLLVKRGYQPDFGRQPLGAIWLYHPRESFKHNQLLLYGSGLVISLPSQSDEHRFGREDKEAFKRFLNTVPIPSLWDRTRRARANTYAWLFISGTLLGGGIIASMAAIEFVKAFLRNSPPN